MRVKRKLNLQIVERLKGHTSLDLVEKCPDQRQVFPFSPCTNGSCEFAIRQRGYMNCSFIASEAGDHTLEEIGKMMGITREGVRLIERRAMLKFHAEWAARGNDDDPSISQPELAPGEDYLDPDLDISECSNNADIVPALTRRELG